MLRRMRHATGHDRLRGDRRGRGRRLGGEPQGSMKESARTAGRSQCSSLTTATRSTTADTPDPTWDRGGKVAQTAVAVRTAPIRPEVERAEQPDRSSDATAEQAADEPIEMTKEKSRAAPWFPTPRAPRVRLRFPRP